ncbi:MAG TPA: hypothetical protein VGA22_14320 [Gemmatimonadales bacterium]
MISLLLRGPGRRAVLAWAVFVLALGIASACSDAHAPPYITPNDTTTDTSHNEQGLVLPVQDRETRG